jgi:hypothetical protein
MLKGSISPGPEAKDMGWVVDEKYGSARRDQSLRPRGGLSEMTVKRLNKYLFLPWLCLFALVSPALAQDSLDRLFQKTGVSRVRVTVENSQAATIPLIDAHNHLNGNTSAEALTGPMDRAGVKRMVLLPRHYRSPKDGGLGSDEQAREYARSHPGKFIPFIGGQRDELGKRSRAWQDLSALDPLLLEMGDKLKGGLFGVPGPQR